MPPNRRAAYRRTGAAVVALAVLSVSVSTHRRGTELAQRWGAVTTVLVVDAPVAAGDPVERHVRTAAAPTALVPDGHLDDLPEGARAAGELARGEILTAARVDLDGSGSRGPGRQRALVPVPLQGRDGAAPAGLAPGDVVDVIGPGPVAASGGRGRARVVASAAEVRSVDTAAVTLDVATGDVAELADALLAGPVVLTVVESARAGSGAGGRDVVDDE